MAKVKGMNPVVKDAKPAQHEGFTEKKIGDMVIRYRPETTRFVLLRGDEFLMSDRNLDYVVHRANTNAYAKLGNFAESFKRSVADLEAGRVTELTEEVLPIVGSGTIGLEMEPGVLVDDLG